MSFSFAFDIDVRCLACGAARTAPDQAERVLEGEVLYADVVEPCACGARRIRIAVKFDATEDPRSGPEAHLGRRT